MGVRTAERTQLLVDALNTAVEFGVGYWADVKDYQWGSENGPYKLGDVGYASAKIRDAEPEGPWRALTIHTMARGIRRLQSPGFNVSKRILGYIAEEDIDSDAAANVQGRDSTVIAIRLPDRLARHVRRLAAGRDSVNEFMVNLVQTQVARKR